MFQDLFSADLGTDLLMKVLLNLGFLDLSMSLFNSLGSFICLIEIGTSGGMDNVGFIKRLEEFVPVYETRPINNNKYGLWFMISWIKPYLMMESGAFKGHSTWVLRQAMPDFSILSLTPRHPEK
ncbi:hypothetical protein MKW92_033782 [Papaver armeniacum]|nr:hypothetical protein MKW92_033782 [Papaver armeniacum]